MALAHVISWMNVCYDEEDPQCNPDDEFYDYRILAEGDSWFSIAGIPTSNILFTMRFDSPTVIVNCARPGDTIRNMAKIARNNSLRDAMSALHGSQWDAILLSGGGNDLIDDAKKIIKKPRGAAPTDPAAYCKEAQILETMQNIIDGYSRIVDQRDKAGSSCANKPIVVHTYDWVTPRNSPARFFGNKVLGPWLYKALIKARIPESRWDDISDYLLGRLRDTIKSLGRGGTNKLPHFHVVTTQGVLKRADPGTVFASNDWLNEIHPNTDGYKKIGTRMTRRLRTLL